MPLSGIQIFQTIKEWIPDQNRFGNDRFGLLQENPLFSKKNPPASGGVKNRIMPDRTVRSCEQKSDFLSRLLQGTLFQQDDNRTGNKD